MVVGLGANSGDCGDGNSGAVRGSSSFAETTDVKLSLDSQLHMGKSPGVV